jgi:hypothetical protein
MLPISRAIWMRSSAASASTHQHTARRADGFAIPLQKSIPCSGGSLADRAHSLHICRSASKASGVMTPFLRLQVWQHHLVFVR